MIQETRVLALVAFFSMMALLFWTVSGELGAEWTQLAIDYSRSTMNPWRALNPVATCLIAISAICAFLSIANLRRLVSVGHIETYELAAIRHCMFGCLLFSFTLSIILMFYAPLFVAMGREDSVVEYSQFLFFLTTSIIWLFVAVTTRNGLILIRGFSIILFLGFLFVAGEEISWGQRIFGFETPKLLSANSQREANIHNMDSGFFNDLFLYGAFVLFGLAPYTYFTKSSWSRGLRLLRPDSALVLILAAGAGFHPGYANEFGQFLIFFGLTACVYGALTTRYVFVYVFGFVTLCLSTMLSFFRDGYLVDRWWFIDEYRELFFSFGILVYSIDIAGRISRAR